MVDPVFALSPISARSAQPTDDDYDAIREAFMETSRGRWFLTEYAKRNRNADTNLVLDAVVRLEASLAAQKQDQRDRTGEVIAAITALLAEARSETAALLAAREVPSEDSPARKGVRVLREMSWTMRENGSDGRIADLLQRQATAIEEGLQAALSEETRDTVLAIFDRLTRDVGGMAGGEAPVPAAKAAPAPQAEQPMQAERLTEPEAVAAVAPQTSTPVVAETPAKVVSQTAAATATEEALLDVPGEIDADDVELTWDEPPAEPEPDIIATAEPAIVATETLDIDTIEAAQPDIAIAPQVDLAGDDSASSQDDLLAAIEAAISIDPPDAAPTGHPAPANAAPAASISLGETLVANGILSKPNPLRADPLSAIRRMTQVEKVAFFS